MPIRCQPENCDGQRVFLVPRLALRYDRRIPDRLTRNARRLRQRPSLPPQARDRPVGGYGLASFRRDMLAALTVAIVALPLSMAIAVASGVSPERGLYAAVIGGFLVSALGGSRYQIGGPAGAFIVLVAATVAQVRPRRAVADGFHLRLHADADRPVAAWRADPLYSACGDRRLHLRHRGHDLCQPAQGSRRLETACRRTRAVIAKARRARSSVANAQSCCARCRRWLGRLDLPVAAPACRTGREC